MESFGELVRQTFKKIEAKKKLSVHWTPQEPCLQNYHTYSNATQRWEPQIPSNASSSSSIAPLDAETGPVSVAIYSWNIDFMIPMPDERMTAALAYLATLVFPTPSNNTPPTIPTVIFLQEMLESDLSVLQQTQWVQNHFHLTDLDPTTWASGYYGTVTLIDRRLPIHSVFRIHYADTAMERDGLFVDLAIPQPKSSKPHLLRLCNTHLESLIADPPLRPLQLRTAAKFMHAPETSSSVLGGDLNAIQEFDAALHRQPDVDLHDAFLEFSHLEPAAAFRANPDTDTWGFTAPTALRDQFGTTRMDKLLYCGRLRVTDFRRFGWDVLIDDALGPKGLELCHRAGTEKAWVTDHLGICATFEVLE